MDGQFSIVVLENLRNQSINRYYFSIYFHKINKILSFQSTIIFFSPRSFTLCLRIVGVLVIVENIQTKSLLAYQ
jgi:hypothetical protein